MTISTEIEAVYRVVTPLFCAGADARSAEIRLPSFKGVLRFWWRALAWSRLRGDLKAIREEEDTLFGSAGGGQSRVLLLPIRNCRQECGYGRDLKVGAGARYLGYGVLESGAAQRQFLRPGFNFTIRMRTRDLNGSHIHSLKAALIAFGILGGMGARSRKGYGSVAIRSLHVKGEDQWRAPESIDDLKNEIKALGNDGNATDSPAYTAMSQASRHVLISYPTPAPPLTLLDTIGEELKDAIRSAGNRRRMVFGLPRDLRGLPHKLRYARRASPFFIHIHECGSTPVSVVSFLPARFLPAVTWEISVGSRRVRQVLEKDPYQPVHDFLDRLKERFADAVEVKP